MNRTFAEQVQMLSYQYENALAQASREHGSEKALNYYLEAAVAQYELSELMTGESAERHKREMHRLLLLVRDEIIRLGIDAPEEMRKSMELLGVKLPEKKEPAPAPAVKDESPKKPAAPKKPADTTKSAEAKKEDDELHGFDPESCRMAEIPDASFKDFGDMPDGIRAVVTCLEVARAKQDYKKLASQMSNRKPDILLYGPPGGGKTHFCKAIGNYVLTEMSGGAFYLVKASQIKHSLVGVSEKRLKAVFEAAKQYEFSVICIDEIDALAPEREGDVPNYVASLVTELLQTIDGVSGKSKAVVIGATNYPWKIDGAVRSRLSTTVYVGLPDAEHVADYLRKNISRFLGKDEKFIEEIIQLCTSRLTNASYRVLGWIWNQAEMLSFEKTMRAHPDNKEVEEFVPLTRQEIEGILARVAIDNNPDYMKRLEEYRKQSELGE